MMKKIFMFSILSIFITCFKSNAYTNSYNTKDLYNYNYYWTGGYKDFPPTSVSFSSDGKVIVLDFTAKTITKNNLSKAYLDLNLVESNNVSLDDTTYFTQSTDKYFVSSEVDSYSGVEKFLKVINRKNKTEVILKAHTAEIYDYTFSPDGKFLVSVGADFNVFLWSYKEFDKTEVENNKKSQKLIAKKQEEKYAKEQKIYTNKVNKWRRTIKSGDYCSYGLIIEVKGSVAKVQTTDYITQHYTEWKEENVWDKNIKAYVWKHVPKNQSSGSSVSIEKWFRIDELYPQ